MKTHYKQLDECLQPIDGKLILIASKPSVGKSAFATNIASNLLLQEGVRVGFINLEMSKDDLLERFSNICGKRLNQLRHRLFIVDDHFSDINSFFSAVDRLCERGCSTIFIDYLSLLPESQKKLLQYMIDLKKISLYKNVTIFAVCSISRKYDENDYEFPSSISNIYGGVDIVDISDVTLLLESYINNVTVTIEKNRFGECKEIEFKFIKPDLIFSEVFY